MNKKKDRSLRVLVVVMEEISCLLIQIVTSQSHEEITQTQERLDAYNMSPEFVSLICEIVANAENDDNLRLSAEIYLTVKCQNAWESIPEESKKFIFENFPNLFVNANDQMLSYFAKLSYILSVRGYVHVMQESITQFLQFLECEIYQKGILITLKSLAKASSEVLFDESVEIEHHPSIVFIQAAFPVLKQLFEQSEDLDKKQRVISIFHYLFKSMHRVLAEYEGLLSFYVEGQCLLEMSMPMLVDGFDDEKFLCSLIKIVQDFMLVPPLALNGELITALIARIIEVASGISSQKVLCWLMHLIRSVDFYNEQFIVETISSITENILMPVFALSGESVELVTTDPVRFAAEHTIDRGSIDKHDLQYACRECIVSLVSRHNEMKEIIMQIAQTAMEKYAEDNDSSALYALFSFCFCGWNIVAQSNSETVKEFLYAAAPLLEADDELARCAYLYLVSSLSKHVIDADLFLAILSQLEVDSPIIKYYACSALTSTIQTIIKNPVQQATFVEGFALNVSDFIREVFTISHDFGDPCIVSIIAECTTLPAFQESVCEIAPDIISAYFSISEAFFDKDFQTSDVFQGLTHLLEVVKDSPIIADISSLIANEIFRHKEFFSTNLKYPLVDLISNNIAYSPTIVDEYWEVAKMLMSLFGENGNCDFDESITVILHNLVIKSKESLGENTEWIIQIMHEMLENEKGVYEMRHISNLLSSLLIALPDDHPEKEGLLQYSLKILSDSIEDAEVDEEDEVDVGSVFLDETFVLFDTVITLFPQQTVVTFSDNIYLLINAYSYFCLYDIQQLSSVASVAQFISEEMRFKIMSSILKGINPDSLFELNEVTDFYSDNSIDRPVVLLCISMDERKEHVITFLKEHAEAENEMAEADGTLQFLEEYFKLYPVPLMKD
jgi:hypothetical protein